MKKTFKMEELDCAHCASKMEEEISKLDGVTSVNINFLAQKLVIEAEDCRFEEILNKAKEICKKIEPDCIIVD